MLKYAEMDWIENFGYDTHDRINAFHIPEDAFWGSNGSIFQIFSYFLFLHFISRSRTYYLLGVLPTVSQLPMRWIPIHKQSFLFFQHKAKWLLHQLEVNVFDVVRRPCTDDKITLPRWTMCTVHMVSSVQTYLKSLKDSLEYHSYILPAAGLLFFYGSCISMSFNLSVRRNRKIGNEGSCKL